MRKSINTIKNEIIKKYKELVECEKKGIFPGVNFIRDIYDIVYDQSCFGDDESECLYNLYCSLISECIEESFNFIKNAQNSEFLNLFDKQIKKINFIIYNLNKGFSYLDRFYIPAKSIQSLSAKSFNILENKFLECCQDNLSKGLLNYLKDNNNLENEKNIMKLKKF